jgi:hypothetical protein
MTAERVRNDPTWWRLLLRLLDVILDAAFLLVALVSVVLALAADDIRLALLWVNTALLASFIMRYERDHRGRR